MCVCILRRYRLGNPRYIRLRDAERAIDESDAEFSEESGVGYF